MKKNSRKKAVKKQRKCAGEVVKRGSLVVGVKGHS
jgi:hypothetical protein